MAPNPRSPEVTCCGSRPPFIGPTAVRVGLALIAGGLLVAGAAGAATTYTKIDLGTLGGPSAVATLIDDDGQVFGTSDTSSGQTHGFVWSHDDGMQDLGTLGGTFTQPEAVNDNGQVVGDSRNAAGQLRAFSWTQAGGMIEVGAFPGGGAGSNGPGAVNHNGQVVGSSVTAAGQRHAFSWTASGGTVDLGTLGGPTSGASDVNDAGVVVGASDDGTSTTRAFRWTQAGGMQALGSLGGFSQAFFVNASGQAAGSGANADGELHALFWTQAGGVVDLGTLGGNFSQAQGIDDDGAVIGYSQLDDEGTVTHPFIWTQAGGMHDLGSLGGDFAIPSRMNDEGQVVGLSSTASGAMHGFSWTQAGGMVDLGTLDGAGMRSDATAVNDSGEIAGFNSSADESGSRAVLWEPPASAGNVHTFGPYAVTTTDNGCSGAPWATDTLSRTWEVKRGPNGSWRLRRIDRGTSVTSGGTSPGNCAANTTPHGTTVRAGTNGKVHGYLAGLVTGGTFNPNATCTADCGTTAGFVSTFFGPTAQFSCTTTSADCNFDFGYGAVGQRLRFYHWEDQGTGAGALLDEAFAGDIAN